MHSFSSLVGYTSRSDDSFNYMSRRHFVRQCVFVRASVLLCKQSDYIIRPSVCLTRERVRVSVSEKKRAHEKEKKNERPSSAVSFSLTSSLVFFHIIWSSDKQYNCVFLVADRRLLLHFRLILHLTTTKTKCVKLFTSKLVNVETKLVPKYVEILVYFSRFRKSLTATTDQNKISCFNAHC